MVKVIRKCKICNKKFETYNLNALYCSFKCRGKSPEWKLKLREARLQEFRGTPKQIYDLTHRLFEGKKLKCAICGKESDICIHHKDKNRVDNTLPNLLPLCRNCHSEFHYKELKICSKCGRIVKDIKKHICPTKKEYNIIAIKRIPKRERCPKCGKLLGKDKSKHSCEHPKGMKGKHHTTKTKKQISKKLSKIKKIGAKVQ